MRNSVNLLIVLYLALAPGMDVSQLLKSVQLCEYFESQMASDPCHHGQVEVAHKHSYHHGHSHGEQSNDSPDEDSDHHHHDENIVVETGVMAGAVSVFSVVPIVVYSAPQVLVQEQPVLSSVTQHSPRAPPWIQFTLTVKLLV